MKREDNNERASSEQEPCRTGSNDRRATCTEGESTCLIGWLYDRFTRQFLLSASAAAQKTQTFLFLSPTSSLLFTLARTPHKPYHRPAAAALHVSRSRHDSSTDDCHHGRRSPRRFLSPLCAGQSPTRPHHSRATVRHDRPCLCIRTTTLIHSSINGRQSWTPFAYATALVSGESSLLLDVANVNRSRALSVSSYDRMSLTG